MKKRLGYMLVAVVTATTFAIVAKVPHRIISFGLRRIREAMKRVIEEVMYDEINDDDGVVSYSDDPDWAE